MPEFHCPRCNATLREEDASSWNLPFDPSQDRYAQTAIWFSCWRCSWHTQWAVVDVTAEVELPA